MLLKATGTFDRHKVTTIDNNRSRLVIYGTSLREIRTWLHQATTQKLAYDGQVFVYVGHYHKTRHAKSEQHDAMSIRHAGWGQGTLGTPLMGGAIKRGAQVSGGVVTRHFIGIIHAGYMERHARGQPVAVFAARHEPKFMHHQKSCTYRGEFGGVNDYRTKSFTFAQLRSL